MNAVLRVLDILLEVAVCSPCLEIVAALDTVALEGALARLTGLLTVAAVFGVCGRCHEHSSVYRLNPRLPETPAEPRRNGAPARRAKRPTKRSGSRTKI